MNRVQLNTFLCVAVGSILIMSGCGGGDSDTDSSSVEPSASAPAATPMPLDSTVAKLEDQGFTCRPGTGNDKGLVQDAECTRGTTEVTLIAWDSRTATEKYATVINSIAAQHPERVLFADSGLITAFAGSETAVSSADKSDFVKVEAAMGSPEVALAPVDEAQQKLEAEGISVRHASRGEADEMLMADGVRVGFFSSAAKAENVGGPLVDILKRNNTGAVKVSGNIVFLMAPPSGMSVTDYETFDRVVSIVEGN